jgi:uncharacterized protein (TIGR02996 family)
VARNEALLNAIIEQPDEDTPRLAYADWLDENGDSDADGARAEFIRVQIELAGMKEADPRREEVEAREKELLNRYGWAWAEEFGQTISEWQFRRGFIERVQMYLETTRENIVAVLQKGPVRHIRDTGQFCDLSGVVASLPDFHRLTGLEFWGLYAFDDALLRQMLTSRHLANLKTLILHHDRNGNTAHEQVIIDAVNSPYRKNIEELAVNVDGCWRGPSRKILQAIAKSPHLKKLRRLDMTNAGDTGNRPQMDVKTIQELGKSKNLAKLESLDMGRTSFPLKAWDAVLKWPFLSKLKWLRLHYARQVRPPSLLTVAEIHNLPKYRQGFEKRVANIDWGTQFISPYDGNAYWQGLSWSGLRQAHLFAMWSFVQKKDYDGLEAAYRADCVKFAGQAAAKAVDALPFEKYQKSLAAGLKQAITSSSRRAARAIYLRIRPDLQWDGEYHVCGEPLEEPFEPREEYSYTGPLREFKGPSFKEAAEVRQKYHATKPLDPGAAQHYLLARTVAAFGRCLAKHKAPVPVFFSCMYALFRMTQPQK